MAKTELKFYKPEDTEENEIIRMICPRCNKVFESKLKYDGKPYINCRKCLDKQKIKYQNKTLMFVRKKSEDEIKARIKRMKDFKNEYLAKITSELNREGEEKILEHRNALEDIWKEADLEEQYEFVQFMFDDVCSLYSFGMHRANSLVQKGNLRRVNNIRVQFK